MGFLQRFSQGDVSMSRVEAFSDAVFAIIVTLLVLEFRVPALQNSASASELGRQLLEMLPKFLSWLISFIIVCKFWLNHHHILRFATHATYGMVWINSIFLMFQSFIPFPTAMIGEYPGNPLAVSFFGIVMAFNTLLFIALQAYINRNLLKPEMAKLVDPREPIKGMIGPASYLLGAAAAWIFIPAAFVVYALTPLFYITPPSPKNTSPPAPLHSRQQE